MEPITNRGNNNTYKELIISEANKDIDVRPTASRANNDTDMEPTTDRANNNTNMELIAGRANKNTDARPITSKANDDTNIEVDICRLDRMINNIDAKLNVSELSKANKIAEIETKVCESNWFQ